MCVFAKQWPCCTAYVLRRCVFANHVTVKRGHIHLSSVYFTKVTRVVMCIQETPCTAGLSCCWMTVEFIHLPSTETCISPKMREIVGLLLMQGRSPFIVLVDVIHPLLCRMNAAESPWDTSEWRLLTNSTDTSQCSCHNCSCGTTVM